MNRLIQILVLLSSAVISTIDCNLLRQWSVPRIAPNSGRVIGSFAIAVNGSTTLVLDSQTCGGTLVGIQRVPNSRDSDGVTAASEDIESAGADLDPTWMGSTVELDKGVHYFNYATMATPFGASRLTASVLKGAEHDQLIRSKYRVIPVISASLFKNKLSNKESWQQAEQMCAKYENRKLANVNSLNLMNVAKALRATAQTGSAMISSWNGNRNGGLFVLQVSPQTAAVNLLQSWDPIKYIICEASETAFAGSNPDDSTFSMASVENTLNEVPLSVHGPEGPWEAHCAACLRYRKVPAVINGNDELTVITQIVYDFYTQQPGSISDNIIKVWVGGWQGAKAAGPLLFIVNLSGIDELIPGASGVIVPGSPSDRLAYLCQSPNRN